MRAYYNEFEPFAARWLRELIREGLIPEGDVDDRSITDVEPADLKDYTQCHFFAGIGGWAYATRLARWPDSRPIWTGSPPCQPFSAAGKRLGKEDERHLWPVWFDLVRQCRPPVIFGEQVAAAVRHGWLDSLQEDLEASDYAVGSVIVPAAGVGGLHKRDRLWFVAHASRSGWEGRSGSERCEQRESGQDGALRSSDRRSGEVAYTDAHRRLESMQSVPGELPKRTWSDSVNDLSVADGVGERSQGWLSGGKDTERQVECGYSGCGSAVGSLAVTNSSYGRAIEESEQPQGDSRRKPDGDSSVISPVASSDDLRHERGQGTGWEAQWRSQHASQQGFWGGVRAVQCKDGKVRLIPTESEIFPLADGISNRVGILRGAGNAIVPQVAAEILKIFT